MTGALRLFILVSSAKVLAYPLCQSQLSENCNNTTRVTYNGVLFVWNKDTSSVPETAIIVHGIVLGLIILLSVLGNGALIVTVIIEKRFRTPTNHLVVSQCTADLCMTLIVQMMTLIALLRGGWDAYIHPRWCIVQVMLMHALLSVTFLHLTLLAIDRYIVIVKSRRMDSFKQREFSIACGMVWLVATILSIPWDVISFPSSTWFEISTTFCSSRYVLSDDKRWCILFVARLILLFVIPGFVTIFCFYHILSVLRTNRRKIGPPTVSNWRKIAIAVYAKSAYTCLAVLCSFCICVIPYLIFATITLVGKNIPYEAFAASRVLAFSNAAIKPIIYIARSVSWSRKLHRLVMRRPKSKSRTVNSPSPKRISRYVVDRSEISWELSTIVKLPKSNFVKSFSTQDFHEMFRASRTKQAWDTRDVDQTEDSKNGRTSKSKENIQLE